MSLNPLTNTLRDEEMNTHYVDTSDQSEINLMNSSFLTNRDGNKSKQCGKKKVSCE